ncbi:MAG: hypothetical protein V4850_30360 [Myxococcota bacterium]
MITVRHPLYASPDRGIALAASILATHGFRVTPSDITVHAVGPSLNSNKENPLRGAGTVLLVFADGAVEGTADLAGTRRLCLFIRVFPPLLVGFLSIFFFFANGLRSGVQAACGLAPMLLVWLIVGPLLAGWIRSRSEAAFRTFVANVAVAR